MTKPTKGKKKMKTAFNGRQDKFAMYAAIVAMIALVCISLFSPGKAAAQPVQNVPAAKAIVKMAPIVVIAKRLPASAKVSRAPSARKTTIAS